MIYLLERYFPPRRALWRCLQEVEGLGAASAARVCAQLGLSPRTPLETLSAVQLDRLTQWVHAAYAIGAECRTQRTDAQARLLRAGACRAQRVARGLPCRGQRTHSNGRTARRRLAVGEARTGV